MPHGSRRFGTAHNNGNRLKGWMGRSNAVIMAVLCLVIGVTLIGDEITGL